MEEVEVAGPELARRPPGKVGRRLEESSLTVDSVDPVGGVQMVLDNRLFIKDQVLLTRTFSEKIKTCFSSKN